MFRSNTFSYTHTLYLSLSLYLSLYLKQLLRSLYLWRGMASKFSMKATF